MIAALLLVGGTLFIVYRSLRAVFADQARQIEEERRLDELGMP